MSQCVKDGVWVIEMERSDFSQFVESIAEEFVLPSASAIHFMQNHTLYYAIWYAKACYGALKKSEIMELGNSGVAWAKLYNSLSRLSRMIDASHANYSDIQSRLTDELHYVRMIICEQMAGVLWPIYPQKRSARLCVKDAMRNICRVIKYTESIYNEAVCTKIVCLLTEIFVDTSCDIQALFREVAEKNKLICDNKYYQKELPV